MKKITKWKFINIILLLISFATYFTIDLYWQNTCLGGKCSVEFMEGILSSFKVAALFTGTIFIFFIPFSAQYFKEFITKRFWWLFIMSYIIAAGTAPVGTNIVSFDRSQVVFGLGLIVAVYAAIFIYRKHKNPQS